jgi:deazaflavin-dependent oxidoreductase (nitroreductase family)
MDMAQINRRVIEAFRAGGEIEGMHRERLLLLTTTGRVSGQPHTAPMMFHREGDRLLVVASAAGAPAHPQWFLNLVADPSVTVEIDDERYAASAAPLEGADHERIWRILTTAYPFFADHQAGVERTIPVVDLIRLP